MQSSLQLSWDLISTPMPPIFQVLNYHQITPPEYLSSTHSRISYGPIFMWGTHLHLFSLFYYFTYLATGFLMEFTNPIPKTKFRIQNMKLEIRRGIAALFWVLLFATIFMWKVERHTPYYGYYETHDFGLKEWLISLVVYEFSNKSIDMPWDSISISTSLTLFCINHFSGSTSTNNITNLWNQLLLLRMLFTLLRQSSKDP